MNKTDKAIYDMMTIWDNMKQKVFRIYSSLITAVCYALYVRRLQCDELMY